MTLSNQQYESERQYLEAVWEEEKEKLATVLQVIQRRVVRLESQLPPVAVDSQTAKAIQDILLDSRDTIASASSQPYFGRVDYLSQEQNSHTIYIGMAHIDGANVYSWTVPVARLWYTNENRYTAPRGEIRVRVDLKRYFKIRDQKLEELNDIYRRELPGGRSAPTAAGNAALTSALSATGSEDGHLQVIVETIEPDQYESIANVSDQVLVIQGSAGSGKSEIGMHRIAYLLSPFSHLPERERPTPRTTLFVGPSASFLEYVSDLLPQLGVQDRVAQVTLRNWLNSRLSAPVNIRSRIWNNLLDSGSLTRFNEQAEAFKGSMAMADVLDRYAKNLLERCRNGVLNMDPLIVVLDGENKITVETNDIRTVLDFALSGADRNLQLNKRRQEFINRITNMVWMMNEQRRNLSSEEARQQRRDIETESVNPWGNAQWPHLDFRQEYATLLSNPAMVANFAKGAISFEDAEILQESVRGALGNGFEDSDIGALTYMDHLLNGTIAGGFRHIVVDEAQDISPIEFRLLQLASVNNWFTILGDTAQRLTPYRGIHRWRDIERVMGRSAVKVQHARTSYRSNQHITRFNNRILRLFDKYIEAPIPFGREGHRVEFHKHNNSEEMYRSIVEELKRIRSLDGLAGARIAILVRDRQNLSRFGKFCQSNEIKEVALFGQESRGTGTVLARIPDTKGLEYDAVIVMGVNESFASTTFNRKLLYIAGTRAKHYLAMHWGGKESPILRDIYSGGVTFFDNTSRGAGRRQRPQRPGR